MELRDAQGESGATQGEECEPDAAGEADGLLYYVMPYVQGDSLRARLVREGALAPSETMRLLRDMLVARPKINGPAIPANFENVLKKPKNSPLRTLGTIMPNIERLRAWVPPCTRPTRKARIQKWVAVAIK